MSQDCMREEKIIDRTSKHRMGIILAGKPGRIFQVKGMVSTTVQISERNV